MQTPNYTPGQFVTASLLNTSQGLVSSSLQDIASGLFTPGLIAPSALNFTFNNNNLSVEITAPKPFRLLTSGGVLASANGTISGATSDLYIVNFSSLVPASGSITAYIVASTLQIGQNAVPVIGPPIGHPDYNPANAPISAYTNLQDSVAFSATTTAPDNITYYEVARTTLTAGQTSVTALDYGNQVIGRPAQIVQTYNGDPNGNLSGTQGALGLQPSMVWDTLDEIMWVCTATGSDSTAVWTGLASLNGSSKQTFNVANATIGTEAVPLAQLTALIPSNTPYDIAGGVAGPITNSQIVLYTPVARACTFTNVYADMIVAPTYSMTFNVTVAGTLVANINFAANATSGSLSIVSGNNFSLVAGQILEVTAQSTADPTAASLSFTFVGTAG